MVASEIMDSAAEEGALVWNDVVVKVASYETSLQTYTEQLEKSNSLPDPTVLSTQMDGTIQFLEEKLAYVSARRWDSLATAVSAEIEAFHEAKGLLANALGLKLVGEEEDSQLLSGQNHARRRHQQEITTVTELQDDEPEHHVPELEDQSIGARKELAGDASTETKRASSCYEGRPSLTLDTSVSVDLEKSDELQRINAQEEMPVSPISLDENDSRPMSPHSISSPYATNQWSRMLGNLPVPGARSRGNSVDSYGASIDSIISSGRYGPNGVEENDDPLKPDPGNEYLFEVENNPFAFTPGHLSKLLNPKSLGAFHAMGGLAGLERGLRTDCHSGLGIDEENLDGFVTFEEATGPSSWSSPWVPPDFRRQQTTAIHACIPSSFTDRKRVFGDGKMSLTLHKRTRFFKFVWIEYRDGVLILLTICALTTIAVGLYQTLAQKVQRETFSWPEGVAICVAIVVVVLLGAVNDWRKERHFLELREQKWNFDRPVKVLRSGRLMLVPAPGVLVGDVLLFDCGDVLPVDGIFIDGHDVQFDESSATGECDLLKKTPANEALRAIERYDNLKKNDPFIISGSKVVKGRGSCLVTATGSRSSWGMIMMSIWEDSNGYTETALQKKLSLLSEQVAKIGLIIATILFFVLCVKFFARLRTNPANATSKGLQFLYIAVIAITIVDVAIPSGLPLAQTVALALATSRMLRSKIFVRDLRACESLGYTTTICTDETALLNEESQVVATGVIGAHHRLARLVMVQQDHNNRDGDMGKEISISEDQSPNHIIRPDDTHIAWTQRICSQNVAVFSPLVIELLKLIITSTTTAEEMEDKDVGNRYVGSLTERALLDFAKSSLGASTISEERNNTHILKTFRTGGAVPTVGVITKLPSGMYRMLVRTSATVLLGLSSTILADPRLDLDITAISEDVRSILEYTIIELDSTPLKTTGFGFKEFVQWPMRSYMGTPTTELPEDLPSDLLSNLTFIGILGTTIPIRADTRFAMRECHAAGINVRIVTAESAATATTIAKKSGLCPKLVMEGPAFRRLSRREMRDIVPRLDVLAFASPEDKRTFMKQLKEHDEKVAVIGSGRDLDAAPAMRAASVGITMQSTSSDLVKEASGVVILDDKFSSVLRAILWGRAVSDSVQKFLQFQLTINICAVLLAFISSTINSLEQSVLNSVQLLWVNLIMDMFAILALAYDPPSKNQSEQKPRKGRSPLITLTMWKMILGQAIFQLVSRSTTLILEYSTSTKLFH